MSELPFMQLYVSDYLGDTRHLSCEQHGAYLLLLMTMWNARGSLPDDDVKLARIVCLSVKKWRSIRGDILKFFDAADGKFTHPRLTRELRKSERQSDSRAAAGALGGAAKALKYNKPPLASAIAKGVAGLQHLPEPYRKRGGIGLKNPTEGSVVLDRWRGDEEALFKACEEITGISVPDFVQRQAWPASIVAQALAKLRMH